MSFLLGVFCGALIAGVLCCVLVSGLFFWAHTVDHFGDMQ